MVNVWAGIIGNHLVGPFIIDGRLDGQLYLDFLENHLNYLLEDVPIQTRINMWYMHYGAPPHFSIVVHDHLNNAYPQRWIGREGPIA